MNERLKALMNSTLFCNFCDRFTPTIEWDCGLCGLSKPNAGLVQCIHGNVSLYSLGFEEPMMTHDFEEQVAKMKRNRLRETTVHVGQWALLVGLSMGCIGLAIAVSIATKVAR